jgi:hypothetical protein
MSAQNESQMTDSNWVDVDTNRASTPYRNRKRRDISRQIKRIDRTLPLMQSDYSHQSKMLFVLLILSVVYWLVMVTQTKMLVESTISIERNMNMLGMYLRIGSLLIVGYCCSYISRWVYSMRIQDTLPISS